MATLRNELHKFVSYNYRWRFACLSQTEFNTGNITYNSGVTLIETGGLGNNAVVQTAVERALGINVEYFIDDVNIEYLHSFNPGTGYANATQLSFTVTEPYSVGLFFQALAIGAAEVGHTNYLNTPFLLACEFVGFDDSGASSVVPGALLCIKLVDMQFSVEASGSVYQLNAIPYNHVAFADTFNTTRTNTTFSGATVSEVLQDFITEINRQEFQKSQQGLVAQPDAYRIEFPNDISSVTGGTNTYTQTVQTGEDAQRAVDASLSGANDFVEAQDFIRQRSIGNAFNLDPNLRFEQEQSLNVVRSEAAQAAFDPSVNIIGNAPIVNNFSDFGINDFGDNTIIWNAERRVWQRGSMSISETDRRFQFAPGTKIERIIEEVILTSDYGQSLLSQTPVDEMVNWFKITSRVFVADAQEDQVSGRPAYEIVYVVTPFRMHMSAISQVTADFSYSYAIDNAHKAYRYSYTGDNSDILEFTFNIDNSFYKELATTANTPANVHEGGNITGLENNAQYSASASASANATSTITRHNRVNFIPIDASGGAGMEENALRAARIFNANILNSDVDNIELELKIWGDPFYLHDSDFGNRSVSAGPEGLNADGTVDFLRSEVFVLIDFKSAVDYNGNLLQIDPINQFSGVYKLVTFTSSFSDGMYNNTLTLLRMANQPSNSILRLRNLLNDLPQNNNALIDELSSVANNEFKPLLQRAQQFQQAYTHFQNLDIENLAKLAPGNLGQVLNQFDNLVSEARQIEQNIQKTLDFIQDPLAGINDFARDFKSQLDNIFKGLR